MEILQIVLLSLRVSATASILSFILGFIISYFLFINNFKGKKFLIDIITALTGVPTVIFGLIILLMLSRKGPLGPLGLLFTPTAIIIAQFFLLLPLIITLSLELFLGKGSELIELTQLLYIPQKKIPYLFFKELKKPLITIFFLGFSRAISEVGAVSLVGGNIEGETRVMTTYIALSTSMGNYNTSIILGWILFGISFSINFILKKGAKND